MTVLPLLNSTSSFSPCATPVIVAHRLGAAGASCACATGACANRRSKDRQGVSIFVGTALKPLSGTDYLPIPLHWLAGTCDANPEGPGGTLRDWHLCAACLPVGEGCVQQNGDSCNFFMATRGNIYAAVGAPASHAPETTLLLPLQDDLYRRVLTVSGQIDDLPESL